MPSVLLVVGGLLGLFVSAFGASLHGVLISVGSIFGGFALAAPTETTCGASITTDERCDLLDAADPAAAKADVNALVRANPVAAALWDRVLAHADTTGVPVLKGDVSTLRALATGAPLPGAAPAPAAEPPHSALWR